MGARSAYGAREGSALFVVVFFLGLFADADLLLAARFEVVFACFANSLFKVANALTQALADVRKPTRPEEQQECDRDHQNFAGTKTHTVMATSSLRWWQES